jgi:outer membrane protein assembly factor BamB
MSDTMTTGLDALWPDIRKEIERARQRRRAGRRFVGFVGVCALAAGMGLAVGTLRAKRGSDPRASEAEQWQLAEIAPLQGVSARYPLICDDLMFAVSGSVPHQRLICAQKHSGTVKWESAEPFADCRFACDGQLLYLLFRGATPVWQCVALHAGSGAVVWRRPADRTALARPSVPLPVTGGVVWSQGRRVLRCSAANGDIVWSRALEPGNNPSVLQVRGGTVFAAARHAVVALNAADGETLWTRPTTVRRAWDGGAELMELGEDRLYLTGPARAGQGCVVCLDSETGEEIWSAESDAPYRLQVADGQLFIRSAALHAVDARSGAPLWKSALQGCGPVAVANGRVYVVDAIDRRALVALDSRSGQTLWRHTAAGSCNGVVADGNMAYISGNEGILHAMALN